MGLDTHPQMYSVEWLNEELGFPCYEIFEGKFAYLQAVMFCDANNVNGRIFYPIKGVVQKVIDGQPIKRGRKKKKILFDINQGFENQIPQAPKALEQIK